MKTKKVVLLALILGLVLTLGFAGAQESSGLSSAEVEALVASKIEEAGAASKDSMTMVWLVMAAALVFFMQAGFAMVEVGLTRAKNAANILMKNLMDFAVGAMAFFVVGWGFMYGASVSGLFGSDQFFLMGIAAEDWSVKMRDWFFQVVFAATAATIVSGAVAERIKFSSYLIYTVFISAIVYPVSGHWIWSADGWLWQLGFHDFAGSTVVHSVGGWAALMGAIFLGPRLGKYVKVNGKVITKAIPGHSLPLAGLGVFILWFGWYGFNAGSTLDGNSMMIGHIAVTTTLGAAAGAFAAMIVSWIWFKKPDVSMAMNGALAGLVGITAGTMAVDPLGAIIIGLVAGVLVVLSVEFIDKVLHIDDPVGAVSVHAVNGVWGTLAVGIFAVPGRIGADIAGLAYGGGFDQLIKQATGVGAVAAWSIVTMGLVFAVLKLVKHLRVSEKEERQGLDINEHGADAYHGFQIFSNM